MCGKVIGIAKEDRMVQVLLLNDIDIEVQFPVNLNAQVLSFFKVGALYALRNYAIVRNNDTVHKLSNHAYTIQYSTMHTDRINGQLKYPEKNFGILTKFHPVNTLRLQITYNLLNLNLASWRIQHRVINITGIMIKKYDSNATHRNFYIGTERTTYRNSIRVELFW